METKEISRKEYETFKAAKPKKGKYKAVMEQVLATGKIVELSKLTRGQVSAISRLQPPEGVEITISYRELKAAFAPKAK